MGIARITKVVVTILDETETKEIVATYENRKWSSSGPLYPRHYAALVSISGVCRDTDKEK